MKKKVVFLSLPMSGFSDEHIRTHIELAKTAYLSLTKLDITQVAFVDNLDAGQLGKPNDLKQDGVWYLGHALQKLATCDEAFFWFDWEKARGCRIEHDVCIQYGIPTMDVDTIGYYQIV